MSEMNESEILPIPDTSPKTTTNTISIEDEAVQKPQAESAPSNIKVGNILNADGLNIVTRCWQPKDTVNIRAILFISHGLAEHAARYDPLAKAFTEVGIMVFAHDHVGHGRSDGERAQILDFLIFSRDVIQHVTTIRNEYPNIPLFLFGHSMGSLIAVDVILQKQELFKGLLLSGMCLKPDPNMIGPTTVRFLNWKYTHVTIDYSLHEFPSFDIMKPRTTILHGRDKAKPQSKMHRLNIV